MVIQYSNNSHNEGANTSFEAIEKRRKQMSATKIINHLLSG